MPATRRHHLDYSPLAGLRALREAIAEQMQARGTRCDPDQVQVVAGAQRGMDRSHACCWIPATMCMEDPGYTGARGAWLAAGASVTLLPVDADGMVVTEARAGCSARVCHAFLPVPAGRSLESRAAPALLDWARRAQAWIVEDDYDCDLRFDRQPLPCLHALDPDGRVIYVGTFSKTLFPALRLGFLIVPRDLTSGFIAARLATELHPPVLEQRVLAAFIQRGHYERHLRRMQAAYAERLDALRRAVDRSGAPLRLRPVHAGMHAVLDVDGVDAERVHTVAAAAVSKACRCRLTTSVAAGAQRVVPGFRRGAAGGYPRRSQQAGASHRVREKRWNELIDEKPARGRSDQRREFLIEREQAHGAGGVVAENREVFEIESRAHGAAHERVVAERARGLPMRGRDRADGCVRFELVARKGAERGVDA